MEISGAPEQGLGTQSLLARAMGEEQVSRIGSRPEDGLSSFCTRKISGGWRDYRSEWLRLNVKPA